VTVDGVRRGVTGNDCRWGVNASPRCRLCKLCGHRSLAQLNQTIPYHETEKDNPTIKNFEFANPKFWVYLPSLLKGGAQRGCMIAADRGLRGGRNLESLVLPLDSESVCT